MDWPVLIPLFTLPAIFSVCVCVSVCLSVCVYLPALLTLLSHHLTIQLLTKVIQPRQALMVFFGCPYLKLFSKIVFLIVFFIIGSNKEMLLLSLLLLSRDEMKWVGL